MLKIVQNKLPIEFDGVIVEIPVNNMSTSTALKLNDFMRVRKQLIEEISETTASITENSSAEEIQRFTEESEKKNRLLNQMMDELYKICIKDYDLYLKYIEQIPIEYIEQFINELIQTMMGTDKKKQSIPTGSESSKSKTESGSTKQGSKKRK